MTATRYIWSATAGASGYRTASAHKTTTALLIVLSVPVLPASGAQAVAFVSIPPLAWFVERIASPTVEVDVLLPPGQSHGAYEPSPAQMARLAQADLLFVTGVSYERAVLRKLRGAGSSLRVVDIRQGLALLPMEHSCEGEGHEGHIEGEPDPHVWLDPQRAQVFAATMCAALSRQQPADGPDFARNLAALTAELAALDARIGAQLDPVRGRAFYVFHPAFGYFAERYGLRQVALETGGKEPGARQLVQLIERARQDRPKVVFVQPQFASSVVRTFAREVGAKTAAIDPLARDYADNLERMALAIRESLDP